ncbi:MULTISPECIES: helix-turn-helix domain-containing protein [Streptomyces]|uniref:Helix-turn-helix domain-containing protein n=1 Tax=Streptomyces changanensis TaxID=2964669 RepID=A0ABY5N6X2_9ACTN|nr:MULTISPECIES: helix-turn-helix domain-containing protein [Streptomyces]UUS30850.1 helix-turn-helix domain-containing protein [Streptomyces changanensis]
MKAALDGIAEMPDPVARARAIGLVLKEQTARSKQFYEMRRQTVLDLRAQKVPYRKIAAELGVSLGTVQDIERGSGRWTDRPPKKGGEE